jgi:hypothetical protein
VIFLCKSNARNFGFFVHQTSKHRGANLLLIKRLIALMLCVPQTSIDGAKPSKYKNVMPKPHTQEAAPADDKSGKAAGESQSADKGGKKDSDNPSNGQSIAQVAGAEGDSKGGKPKEGDEKENLIVDLKKENREMKKMIRDEVIPTIQRFATADQERRYKCR